MADPAVGMLDRVCRGDMGMASAHHLPTGTPLRWMARRRAPVLLHSGPDVLVPRRPAVAQRLAMAAMGDAPVPAACRRPEYDLVRAVHLFWPSALSLLRDRATHRRLHTHERSNRSRRHNVGTRFNLLSRPGGGHRV